MNKTVTFNELRRIKDSLPDGTIHKIAQELCISVETVRNYFGGWNYQNGKSCGVHIEPGPDGGIVMFDDSTILEKALVILGETNHKVASIQDQE
ncbi:MAG: DNA-binding protein [Candidatus Azobacteroides sp.]|nr:DNA-binding protein [Candidatus Azobacteroides sp.]